MSIALTFHGAAGTVTGSCVRIDHPQGVLLVDCGLFQGPKTLRELNYGAFPFRPQSIDAVLLTHAHIDHSGLLPKLHRDGFAGKIIATDATADLLQWLLPDAGQIQESEVEKLNRRRRQRGEKPVEPIYSQADAEKCLTAIETTPLGRWQGVAAGVRARFWPAGHILGSASIEIEIATDDPKRRSARLLFSGDIGPGDKAFHADADAPEGFDAIVMEATYGDRPRVHLSAEECRALLAGAIRPALERGGNLLIPVFAVERTQELLYDLEQLARASAIPRVPIFLDSPLAARATQVFAKHLDEAAITQSFRAPNLKIVRDVAESIALNRIEGGSIIMAGSGMCDAGRIRHHLRHNLWRQAATVLLVGYQAPGTLGALLETGAGRVRIQGDDVAVKATIVKLDAYSAHAGQSELVDWAQKRLPVRSGIFLCHGEETALVSLHDKLLAIGLNDAQLVIPRLDQTFTIGDGLKAPDIERAPPRLVPFAFEAVRAGRDWHNDYAAFVLDLKEMLDGEPSDAHRARLLHRLQKQLKDERR